MTRDRRLPLIGLAVAAPFVLRAEHGVWFVVWTGLLWIALTRAMGGRG
jgi:hypothetical protein